MESPEADKAGNNLSCMEAIRMMNAVKKKSTVRTSAVHQN